MPGIHTSEEFNKQVISVWIERPGFTGYQALDFTKLDDLELYSSGILNQTTGLSSSTSSLLTQAINLNSTASSLNSKLYVTGDSWPEGVKGTIVFQGDLSAQFDNVDIAGYAGADISGIFRKLQDGTQVTGTVTAIQEKSSSISNFNSSGTNGTVLIANSNRKELYIQNLDTGVLYVKYGAGASSSSFNFVLAASTASNAGDGGSLSDQAYSGVVSASGIITPNYIAWERS